MGTVIINGTRYDVRVSAGCYVVTQLNGHARLYTVGKDKTCSCGGSAERQCRHIKAVARYLQEGGERAPSKVGRESSTSRAIPETCPICGGAITVKGVTWRCEEDVVHYWMWRGQKVRKFLTQPHPAKVGAFYEQTPEQRKAFLAATRLRGSYTGRG
jgi:hypothetical protein